MSMKNSNDTSLDRTSDLRFVAQHKCNMSTDFRTPPKNVSMKNHFAIFKLLRAGTWTDEAKLTGIFLKLFT